MILRKPEHVQAARQILQHQEYQDKLAILGELLAIKEKLIERGPWEQHCTDYGEPYSVCIYCGIDNGTVGAELDTPHNSDCLWLAIEE